MIILENKCNCPTLFDALQVTILLNEGTFGGSEAIEIMKSKR